VAVAAAVAIVEYAALRRTERRHTARASLARLRPSACRRAW